jgi:hypothetical protein
MSDHFLTILRRAAGVGAAVDVRRRRWPLRLACTLALALVLLTTLAASHHHDSSVESHHCLVCGVLADGLSGSAKQAAPVPLWVLLPYVASAAPAYRRHFAAPRLLPPSCGPPVPSQAAAQQLEAVIPLFPGKGRRRPLSAIYKVYHARNSI